MTGYVMKPPRRDAQEPFAYDTFRAQNGAGSMCAATPPTTSNRWPPSSPCAAPKITINCCTRPGR
jgi:hypothetical protein